MRMRCVGINTGKKLPIGSLFPDADAGVSIVDGKEIPLTMRELDIALHTGQGFYPERSDECLLG